MATYTIALPDVLAAQVSRYVTQWNSNRRGGDSTITEAEALLQMLVPRLTQMAAEARANAKQSLLEKYFALPDAAQEQVETQVETLYDLNVGGGG